MGIPHLLVHHREDNVGVVVVEGLTTGTEMLAVVIADDSSFTLIAREDVPIGHKIALNDLKAGEAAIKYGQDIGRITADVDKGRHVHIHNLKTKRW
ncbi:MAG: UxaA family hydrolase [Xanthobacteraceae bacterium]